MRLVDEFVDKIYPNEDQLKKQVLSDMLSEFNAEQFLHWCQLIGVLDVHLIKINHIETDTEMK